MHKLWIAQSYWNITTGKKWEGQVEETECYSYDTLLHRMQAARGTLVSDLLIKGKVTWVFQRRRSDGALIETTVTIYNGIPL